MTSKFVDRDSFLDEYIDEVIDSMELDAVLESLKDFMYERYDGVSDDSIIEEASYAFQEIVDRHLK